MHVLLAYPGTTHSTYDVAVGYHEALEQLGHRVTPFLYHEHLNYHGGALRYWDVFNDQRWTQVASEALVVYVVKYEPDVVLIVSGLTYHLRTFGLLAKMKTPVALLFTESPYGDGKQRRMLEHCGAALAFTNEWNSPKALGGAGVPVVYLPHSYNPRIHYKGVPAEGYCTDVFFHGTYWPERRALFEAVDWHGINHRIVGVGDRGDGVMAPVVRNEELAEYYRGAKVALNHHRTLSGVDLKGATHIADGVAFSIGPRAYEIAACGAFQLCDGTRPELREVFGDSVATYKDADDLSAKIRHYLSYTKERQDMAEESRRLVQGCTFADRARRVLVPTIERWA